MMDALFYRILLHDVEWFEYGGMVQLLFGFVFF